jgi:hypothetical protein
MIRASLKKWIQPYDSTETVLSKTVSMKKWEKCQKATPKPLSAPVKKQQATLLGDKYLFLISDDDSTMRDRFEGYLETTGARGTTGILAKASVILYVKGVFGGGAQSLASIFKREIGESFQLNHLMFKPDRSHILFEMRIAKLVCTVKEGVSAAMLLSVATGTKHLLDYMEICAGRHPGLDRRNPEHQFALSLYKEAIKDALNEIRKNLSGLSNKSSKEAEAKKLAMREQNPNLDKEAEEALIKYIGDPHYVSYLDMLENLAKSAHKGDEISKIDLEDCGRWLMIMTNYFNGARLQAAGLLKNEHVMMQQRASRSGDTVELDKGEIGADQFAFFTIGVTNPNEEAGKTGRVELALPKSLSDALNNYMIAKKSVFGPHDPADHVFLRADGKPISYKALSRTSTFSSISTAMNMTISMTFNRIVVATIMCQQGAKGETGLQHTGITQKNRYNSRKRQEGLYNKLQATQKRCDKAREGYTPDVEHQAVIKESQNDNAEIIRNKIVKKQIEEEYTAFKSGFATKTARASLTSEQRSALVESILRCDSVEWSCMFLVGPPVPCSPKLDILFERYLYSSGPHMDRIRELMAQLAVTCTDPNKSLFRQMTSKILHSFKTFNATVRQNGFKKGPPRHLLFNVGTGGKRARLATHISRPQKRRKVEPEPKIKSKVLIFFAFNIYTLVLKVILANLTSFHKAPYERLVSTGIQTPAVFATDGHSSKELASHLLI